ncbi:hypothetical protein KCM76_12425 [Zooshikella marina]|uniref:hypothetical protein n=1 Tax=Zooshikella ganghwensis TaxID=202772 RepID=UPI001BAEF533|nr:hypothetical protein [Zooshikella ganghwensis]MBU2706790.1 hypothetical protein [Zooshikella ganghwensis]
MSEQPLLSKESYKKIIDSIVEIAHTMNNSVEDIKQVSSGKNVNFARRAIGNALGELMEAIWDIEDIMPDLKGYYRARIAERGRQRN